MFSEVRNAPDAMLIDKSSCTSAQCLCVHVHTHSRRAKQSGRADRVRESSPKSPGLLVMGLWVILIFFFKLLYSF